MRTLIQNRDLKRLFGGAALATAAGLVMGLSLYPNLDEDEVGGPQILMNGGGPRSDAPATYASVADYGARVPDYVIGTDSLKPPQYRVLAYSDRAEPEYAHLDEASGVMAYEAPEVSPANWRDEPAEPSAYPSQRGNVALESDLPAPPEPPMEGEEYPTGA